MLKFKLALVLLLVAFDFFGQSAVDSILFYKINKQRISMRKKALIWDKEIYKAAEYHSKYLLAVTNNEIEKQDSTKKGDIPIILSHEETSILPNFNNLVNVEDRFKKYTKNQDDKSLISENIFERIAGRNIAGYHKEEPEQIASEIFSGWMNSPPHKKIMLDSRLTHAACCTSIQEDEFFSYIVNHLNNLIKYRCKRLIACSTIDFYKIELDNEQIVDNKKPRFFKSFINKLKY